MALSRLQAWKPSAEDQCRVLECKARPQSATGSASAASTAPRRLAGHDRLGMSTEGSPAPRRKGAAFSSITAQLRRFSGGGRHPRGWGDRRAPRVSLCARGVVVGAQRPREGITSGGCVGVARAASSENSDRAGAGRSYFGARRAPARPGGSGNCARRCSDTGPEGMEISIVLGILGGARSKERPTRGSGWAFVRKSGGGCS